MPYIAKLCLVSAAVLAFLLERNFPGRLGAWVLGTYNLSTWKAEAGGLLGLYSETLSQQKLKAGEGMIHKRARAPEFICVLFIYTNTHLARFYAGSYVSEGMFTPFSYFA